MIPETLQPDMELLRKEFVLVQAWKKTAGFIRYHNWFSDTLALDRAAVDLPRFLAKIRERLKHPADWQNDPLRIVPAPKSQEWTVARGSGRWKPVKKRGAIKRIRPLAHVSLADQVVSTALMLCLADRVETLQGDPRKSIGHEQSRREAMSYGNRLFCDEIGGKLRHRWGSAKLYRAYFQDYRKFLARPEVVANGLLQSDGKRVFAIHADLRQFYDRVRPKLLATAMDRICRDGDDSAFYNLAKSVLDWTWDPRDHDDVAYYAKKTKLGNFSRVALPQGLVASGFFANVVLLSFDNELRQSIGKMIGWQIRLADACRYVDDLRITVIVYRNMDCSEVKSEICDWLRKILSNNAQGLDLSDSKTKGYAVGADEHPIVRQSARMDRIQAAVSGGFGAHGGEEILDAIQGLMRAQEALGSADRPSWDLSPVPDVRGETVARFAAARFRRVFRSIRPLLKENGSRASVDSSGQESEPVCGDRAARTQSQLDEDARAFAFGLIQRWVEDPSNVRLLRIGLDLWPDETVLKSILKLLRPFTEKDRPRGAQEWVAWYCLSEVLRVGAIETGLAADGESLPSGVDLKSYRKALCDEAVRLVELPLETIPWYLRQQALLFLATFDPTRVQVLRTRKDRATLPYMELIRFLGGKGGRRSNSDFAILAVLARRSFMDRKRAIGLVLPGLNPARSQEIAVRDPTFMIELIFAYERIFNDLPERVREDLSGIPQSPAKGPQTLAETVLREHPCGSLRNELSALRFAREFLQKLQQQTPPPQVITPGQVHLEVVDRDGIARVEKVRIDGSQVDPAGSLYQPPGWCAASERWRFQIGFLLRFILSGSPDFTRPVGRPHWKETELVYRLAENHWYQRLYGLYSGQTVFGDDWLPISDWMEGFLLALLRWPGCRVPDKFDWVEHGIENAITGISGRIKDLERRLGTATGLLILPMIALRPTATAIARPLRACVVQTVFPTVDHIGDAIKNCDPTMDHPAIRRDHRRHLSAALDAVERMMELRATHKATDGCLDWLILPELAVHPRDIHTHLVPFARTHKTIILTGLTYDRVVPGKRLVNSALWIIPEWTDANELQVRIRRQGKKYLSPSEQDLNGSVPFLMGFRPCQWLVGYPWSIQENADPVWLTAAVCYDATDLGLAADLKDQSDVFAIPALNKDVKTFDKMAQALHYHMFQLVIVANNGQYGGSNAYWPRTDDWVRQVFHMHGQPQASVAFLEIDDIGDYLNRRNQARRKKARRDAHDWKYPPAGM